MLNGSNNFVQIFEESGSIPGSGVDFDDMDDDYHSDDVGCSDDDDDDDCPDGDVSINYTCMLMNVENTTLNKFIEGSLHVCCTNLLPLSGCSSHIV